MKPEIQEAISRLRQGENLDDIQRASIALTLETEIERLLGINGRNKERFETLKAEKESAQRDAGIYKSMYETQLTRVKQLELQIMAHRDPTQLQADAFMQSLREAAAKRKSG